MSPGKALVAGAAVMALTYLLVGPPSGGSTGDMRPPDETTVLRGAAVDEAMARYRTVSFAQLSGFDYAPDSGAPAAVAPRPPDLPDDVTRLNGQRVAVRGFMMPLDFDGEGVTRFILNGSYDMCLFGAPVAAPHQWIAVQMTRQRRTAVVHLPIVVFGTLSVGEERRDGRVLSLYRVQADAIAFPDAL